MKSKDSTSDYKIPRPLETEAIKHFKAKDKPHYRPNTVGKEIHELRKKNRKSSLMKALKG